MDTIRTLTVKDRLMALTILPKQGSIVNLKLKHQLSMEIGFSSEDREGVSLEQTPDGRAKWNQAVQEDYSVTVDFGEAGFEMMKKTLRDLEQRDMLPEDALGLWKLFVDPEFELATPPGVEKQEEAI